MSSPNMSVPSGTAASGPVATEAKQDLIIAQQEALLKDTKLQDYKFVDGDESGVPAYYGFQDVDGNFYILRYDETGPLVGRYFYGAAGGYAAAWAGRAGLAYDTPENVTEL